MRKGKVERGEEKMKSKKKTDRRENTVTSLEGFFFFSFVSEEKSCRCIIKRKIV